MGDVISLIEHQRNRAAAPERRRGRRSPPSTFAFDLSLPGSYLAAERVDRLFDPVQWEPVCGQAFWGGQPLLDEPTREATVRRAEQRAAALSTPLIWPEAWPADTRPAMRAAALACELGRGPAFALAAGRLAFCGGFDLSDPEVLAEAAAAAGVPLDACLEAARDEARDGVLERRGRRLLALGASELPVLRVGGRLFSGEERLPEALAAARAAEAPALRRPASA